MELTDTYGKKFLVRVGLIKRVFVSKAGRTCLAVDDDVYTCEETYEYVAAMLSPVFLVKEKANG